VLASGQLVYGLNTGFGKLASTRIPDSDHAQLQLNLLRSHAVGVGEPMTDAVVRLMLLLKAASLGRGHSGVSPALVRGLLDLLAHDLLPVVPCKGSVGASGDLAPLAHLCLPLIGEGQVRLRGQTLPAGQALQACGLQPIALGAKEGLALINGTQASTALAIEGLFAAEQLLCAGVLVGALTLDAALVQPARRVIGDAQQQGLFAERRPELHADRQPARAPPQRQRDRRLACPGCEGQPPARSPMPSASVPGRGGAGSTETPSADAGSGVSAPDP
jgi:histidine ammonia-lyase